MNKEIKDKIWEKMFKDYLKENESIFEKFSHLSEEIHEEEYKEEEKENVKNELSKLTKEELLERIIKTLDKLDGSSIDWDGYIYDANYEKYDLEDLEDILKGENDDK